jgi:chromatin assembly factor 1 subunit A
MEQTENATPETQAATAVQIPGYSRYAVDPKTGAVTNISSGALVAVTNNNLRLTGDDGKRGVFTPQQIIEMANGGTPVAAPVVTTNAAASPAGATPTKSVEQIAAEQKAAADKKAEEKALKDAEKQAVKEAKDKAKAEAAEKRKKEKEDRDAKKAEEKRLKDEEKARKIAAGELPESRKSISPEKVKEIYADVTGEKPMTVKEAVAKHGVHRRLIRKIRKGTY